jgi:glycosyltransferase involved in cell wall biosynthesis
VRAAEASSVLVVLQCFPVRSETFILGPLLRLIARGVDVRIVARGSAADLEAFGLSALAPRCHYLPAPAGRALFSRARAWILRKLDAFPLGRAAVASRWLRPLTVDRSQVALLRSLAKPEVVHLHFGPTARDWWPALDSVWPDVPRVVGFHGYDVGFAHKPHYYDALWRPFGPAQRRASVIVCCNFFRQALLGSGCEPSALRVLRYGIDRAGFAPRAPAEASAPYFLFVGRHVEKKGIEHLVTAFGAASARLPGVDLRIVGDGPLTSSLVERCRDLGVAGRARFLGALPHGEIPAQLAGAVALVAPSVTTPSGDHEGVPNTILEALAAGIPVIASRHAGIPEAVTDGVDGILTDEGDVAALANAMVRLATDPPLRARLAGAAPKVIAARYDLEKHVNGLVAIYREAVASSPKSARPR